MIIDTKMTPEQVMPEAAIPMGAIIITLWLDPTTGDECRSTWANVDASLATSIGLLELAKADIINASSEQ